MQNASRTPQLTPDLVSGSRGFTCGYRYRAYSLIPRPPPCIFCSSVCEYNTSVEVEEQQQTSLVPRPTGTQAKSVNFCTLYSCHGVKWSHVPVCLHTHILIAMYTRIHITCSQLNIDHVAVQDFKQLPLHVFFSGHQ